jgi:hypothetical protein
MSSIEIFELLGNHVGLRVGSIAHTLKTIAVSNRAELSPEIFDALSLSAEYLEIVSINAVSIVEDEAKGHRTKIHTVIRELRLKEVSATSR